MSIQTVEERLAARIAKHVQDKGKQPNEKLVDNWKAQYTVDYETEIDALEEDADIDDDDDDVEVEDVELQLKRAREENARLKATIETLKPSRGQFGLSPVSIWVNDAKLSDTQIRTMLGLDSNTPITSKPSRDGSGDRRLVKLGKSGKTLEKLQACIALWSTQKLDIK